MRSSSVISRHTVVRRDPDRRTCPAASSSRSSVRVGLYPAPVCSAIAVALNPRRCRPATAPTSRRARPRRLGEAASPSPSPPGSAWRASGSGCSRHRARRRLVRACQRSWPAPWRRMAARGGGVSGEDASLWSWRRWRSTVAAWPVERRARGLEHGDLGNEIGEAAVDRGEHGGRRTCGEGTQNQRARCHEQQTPPPSLRAGGPLLLPAMDRDETAAVLSLAERKAREAACGSGSVPMRRRCTRSRVSASIVAPGIERKRSSVTLTIEAIVAPRGAWRVLLSGSSHAPRPFCGPFFVAGGGI